MRKRWTEEQAWEWYKKKAVGNGDKLRSVRYDACG